MNLFFQWGGRAPYIHSVPWSPMSKSDKKMNNIFRNYPSHNYIKIHSRMHPIALFHEIFPEDIPSNPLAMKLNIIIRTTARHSKRDLLQFSHHYLKIIPCLNMDFTLDNSFNPPPPPPPITIGYVTIMQC